MDLRLLSGLLLFGQIVSLVLIFLVLRTQRRVSKTAQNPELNGLRRVLFGLSLVIFVGNIIPIIINVLTLAEVIVRSTKTINLVGITYSVSNTLVAVASSVLVFMIYRLAARTLLIVEQDKETALDLKSSGK